MNATSERALEVEGLTKIYGDSLVLHDIDFHVGRTETVALLGPSGSGKSTLLHLIAGLEQPDQGSIRWEGRDLANVPTHRRGFGLMFQEFALFPHLNVFENVAYGLRATGMQAEPLAARVAQILSLVGLEGFGGRNVETLSGGERQRVALARSLAPGPRLLMLDEPLGALDRTLRERLMLELPRLLRRLEQTALYVTHDQEEAFAVAQRVVILEQGRIAQIGTPDEVYRQPASPFVASFLGLSNLLPVRVISEDGRIALETPVGTFAHPGPALDVQTVLLRPDRVEIGAGAEHSIEGTVEERSFRGSTLRAVVRVGDSRLTFDFPSRTEVPEVGAPVSLSFDPAQALQVYP